MKVSFGSLYSSAAVAALLAVSTPAFAQSAPDDETDGIADIVVTARKTSESLQSTPVAVTAPTGETLEKAQVVSVQDLPRLVPGLVVQASTGQPASSFIGIRGQAASDALLAIDQAVGQYFDGVYIARSSGALFNFVDVERVEVLRGAQGTLFGRNTTGGAVSIMSNKPTGDLEGSVRLRYGNYSTWETTGVLNLPIKGEEAGLRLVAQHVQNNGYGRNLSFGTSLGGDNVDFVRGTLKVAPEGSGLSVTVMGDYSNRTGEGQIVGLKSYYRDPVTGNNRNATAQGLLGVCSGATPNALCPVRGPVTGSSYANYAVDVRGKDNFYDVALSLIPYSKAESWGVGVITEYDFNGSLSLKSITAWRGVDTASLSDNDGTPFHLSGGRFVGDGNIISQTQFSEEVQLSAKAMEDRLQVILGGFYFTESGNDLSRSYSAFPLGTRLGYNDGDINNKSYAGFGQMNFSITPELRVTGGLRYTKDERSILRRNRQENTTAGVPNGTFVCSLAVAAGAPCEAFTEATFDYWSYTLGFDWRPTDNVFVYIKTNKASRAGGFNPRATGTTPLQFNPETVKDYEIGFKLDLMDRKVRLNTALFQTDYDGIQRTVPAIIGGVLSNTIINAASAQIRGLEAELTVQPTRNSQIGISATFLDPKFKDFTIPLTLTTTQDVRETPYAFASKTSYSVYGDYTIPLASSEINVRLDYAWRAKQATTGPLVGPGFNQDFKNTAIIPSYGLLNGQIAWKLENPNLELAVYGQNIAGKKYFTRFLAIENSLGVTAYSPGTPAMYGVRATYRFGGK
ncbi:TonB-dependent receptor [Sphingorhabdus sp.]|jgi:iron complex outermembrane receptor protein|uniref:TonB-dependent receptor n=1 Tax=Sphingorhabdus sp. TaxID=1902408 RepID=UPI0037C576D0